MHTAFSQQDRKLFYLWLVFLQKRKTFTGVFFHQKCMVYIIICEILNFVLLGISHQLNNRKKHGSHSY